VIGQPLLIHFSGNLKFKKSVTSLWKCGGAPSYWNRMSSGSSSSKICMRNSSTWGTILTTVSVALQVERFGNSSGMNHKLDHITYSSAFSSHSSAFWFMSNVTAKWYTFHAYILYNNSSVFWCLIIVLELFVWIWTVFYCIR
jgi:hypothetical protein